MKYTSTRGGVSSLSFCDAVMMGLASDGGLLVPESIPNLADELPSFGKMSYQEIAYSVMSRFIDDIPEADLKHLISKSYETFDDKLVTPLVKVDDFFVCELFHGPTLAFKDVALQFLGNTFEYILEARDGKLNILGATSGDTGSAAIAGVRGKERINIFIMFPEGRTSLLQEKQMTTILDDNVQNIAIEGSFDDCQSILKNIFSELSFKEEYQLGAVNSVNWARVLAQVVYYFSIYVQLGCPARFQVSVPTGNFGNIFAGYIARQMGLPLDPMILATNQNDILHRFFETGVYERGEVHYSRSPAMDIQVASNFERYLYFMFERKADKVMEFMTSFAETGVAVTHFNTRRFDHVFRTGAADDAATLATIKKVYDETSYLIDPHTAVGVNVGRALRDKDVPLVCLATAHPAKFDDAIVAAIPGDSLVFRHESLEALRDAPSRKSLLPADIEAVKKFIVSFQQKGD